jgi:hypothetical protein
MGRVCNRRISDSIARELCSSDGQLKPKKLYTLEGRPPSVFVRPVVGEGLSTVTDFVQYSRMG